jgi:pantothenate kinase
MTSTSALTVDQCLERARQLADSGQRRVLGIAGPPAAGKGVVTDRVLEALGGAAVQVPMDGFHLAEAELHRLGRHERKGAPDTFDAAGYVALLRRIRAAEETVYAPEFHREVEESYAGSIAVPPDVPLVITEGNYLLLDQGPFAAVRDLLDEAWFLVPDDRARVERLVRRHVRHGRSPEAAREWVQRSDERNAELIARTRPRADVLVDPG